MNESDDRADNEFRNALLKLVQILTFAIALAVLAMTYYMKPTMEISDGQDQVRAEGGGGDVVRPTEDPAG